MWNIKKCKLTEYNPNDNDVSPNGHNQHQREHHAPSHLLPPRQDMWGTLYIQTGSQEQGDIVLVVQRQRAILCVEDHLVHESPHDGRIDWPQVADVAQHVILLEHFESAVDESVVFLFRFGHVENWFGKLFLGRFHLDIKGKFYWINAPQK